MATPLLITIFNTMIQNNSPFQRRNGSDHLSVFLVVAAVVIIVIASVVDNETAKMILDAAALIMVIYSSFRMLSTNIAKRREENDKFLSIFGKKADYSHSDNTYYWNGNNSNYAGYRNATPTGSEERARAKEEKAKAKEEERRRKAERRESEKIYAYYKCPKCRAELRVPRGKGKIKIKCPKCGEEFIKRT